jgi:uncharacterized RDD family membrane protein YckC
MSEPWTPTPPPASLPMNYALWADRVLAALADGGIALLVMIVLYLLLAIVMVLFAGISAVDSQAQTGVLSLIGGFGWCGTCCLGIVVPPVSYLVAGLYNKVYLVSKRGYSIGQGLMKLRVVDAQGNNISMQTSIIRLLATVGLGFIPLVGGLLDLLWPLWDPQRQTLHDKAVGTFVVKTG